MCRLFAFVSRGESTAGSELGDDGLRRLTTLAQVHADGWGWSGVRELGEDPAVHKSVQSAFTDPAFVATLGTKSRAAMVHLRWATLGLNVETNNTHPFLADGVSFEHNGSLEPLSQIRSMLSAPSLAGMHGHTDSEMYFALIREKTAEGLDLSSATLQVARHLRNAFPGSSLNAILLDAHELIVVNAHAHTPLAPDVVAEIAQYNLPIGHAEDYYALSWITKPDGTVLIGSAAVSEPDWSPLPDEAVITIRLSDARVSIASLAESPAVPSGAPAVEPPLQASLPTSLAGGKAS